MSSSVVTRATTLLGVVASVVAIPAVAVADTLPQPAVTPIAWTACAKPVTSTFTCATLSVPLDYGTPGGARISVALMRKAATSPGTATTPALAPIVLNPGGPGGSGLELLQGIYKDPPMVRLNVRHDLVAFDPRGVGASTAVKCGSRPTKQLIGTVDELTLSKAEFAKRLKRFIAGCKQHSGTLLPFLGTADVARDIEQLRAGMAQPKIDFLGYSYGTFLGATYAALFPESVGAFVLDGSIDPDQYANHPLADDLVGARANQIELQRFVAYAHRTFKFGRKSGLAGYRKLLRSLEAKPRRVKGFDFKTIHAGDFKGAIVELIAVRDLWPALGSLVAALEKGDAQSFGQLVEAINDADTAAIFPALLANAGVDRVAAPSEITSAYIRKARKVAPDFEDDSWPATLAAALWPDKTHRFAGPWAFPAAPGRAAILVIGTTYDPRTPYSGAVALTKQLGNATLLTLDGDGHTAFNGNNGDCIDNAVVDYFDLGIPPEPGRRCTRPASSDQP